ncbi:MAG: tyrosine-type recombinase/integrase [Phycisphaerales bacterium]
MKRSAQNPGRASNRRGTERPRRLPIEVLDKREVAALLDACRGHGVTDVRNRALIAVLYRSGLRVSEALSLHPKDVDAVSGAIRVLRGKGGRSRTVGIDQGGIEHVDRWLRARASLPFVTPLSPLFCTRTGGAITTASIRRLLPTLARAASIAKRVHAHGLRHTHASELRSEGLDIGLISRQLGHADISTTARYLDHINPQAVIQAIGRRGW